MVDGLLWAKAFDHLKVKTLYCKFKLKPLKYPFKCENKNSQNPFIKPQLIM
jgi:hypothetical protein